MSALLESIGQLLGTALAVAVVAGIRYLERRYHPFLSGGAPPKDTDEKDTDDDVG